MILLKWLVYGVLMVLIFWWPILYLVAKLLQG